MAERRMPTRCALVAALACCTHDPQRVSPVAADAADATVDHVDAAVDHVDAADSDLPSLDRAEATVDAADSEVSAADAVSAGDSPGVTAIVSGHGYTCALTRDQRVWCWGGNDSGQIGNGRDDDGTIYPPAFGQYPLGAHASPFPSLVRGLTGVLEIAGGGNFACARTAGGVWCWGGVYFDLRSPRPSGIYYTSVPVMMAGLGPPSDIVSIASGDLTVCAITRDRRALCWGWADFGQLGRGPTPDGGSASSAEALPVLASPGAPLTGVQSLALGQTHACALLMDGTVRCWGQGDSGQLGDAATDTWRISYASSNPGLSHVTRLVAGSSHTCALVAGDLFNEVWCWGRAYAIVDGAPGVRSCGSSGVPCYPAPTLVTAMYGAQDLVAGAGDTCALIRGALRCWGANEYGQFGAGVRLPSTVIASGVRAATLSENHLCARMSDDTVRCAGEDNDGVTGTGAATGLTPSPVRAVGDAGGPLLHAAGIAVGIEGACVVFEDHGAECWGRNLGGVELGTVTIVSQSEWPLPVTALEGGENAQIAEIGGGIGFACARLVSGVVRCWGFSSEGLVGAGLTGVTMLRVGPDHACVLQGGAVRCWGAAHDGQLGVEPRDAGPGPYTVPLPSGARIGSISVGAHHACAIVLGSAPIAGIWCWGLNSEEQLGVGASAFYVAVPARVTACSRGASETLAAAQVACGDGFTCALFDGGEVRCWGHNGDLYFTGTNTVIAPSEHATLLAAGAAHACASDGARIWCWGRNNEGQLGSGDTVDRYPTPVEVAGLALPTGVRVRDLALGGDTSCALLSDGSVRCWGDGSFGHLGNGRSTRVDMPTSVRWR